jgi:ribonuclease Z
MSRLLLLGTGTPAPLVHRAGSSYLLQTGEQTLLIDCGPGSVRRLLEAGIEITDIDHLLLTHLHYDHCVDYGYLTLTRWDQGVGQIDELQVIGPAPVQHMTDRLFATDGVYGPDLAARTQHPGSHFIYERRGGAMPRKPPMPVVGEVVHGDKIDGPGWRLDVAEVVHVQPQPTCLAYRLETAEGETIVFGADTAPTAALTELARDADVLLHMCHFINGAIDDQRLTSCCSGHLDAAHTAADAGVSTLVLVHLTEMMETPGVRERLLGEVAQIFPGQVIFSEDLLEVPLGQITTQQIR